MSDTSETTVAGDITYQDSEQIQITYQESEQIRTAYQDSEQIQITYQDSERIQTERDLPVRGRKLFGLDNIDNHREISSERVTNPTEIDYSGDSSSDNESMIFNYSPRIPPFSPREKLPETFNSPQHSRYSRQSSGPSPRHSQQPDNRETRISNSPSRHTFRQSAHSSPRHPSQFDNREVRIVSNPTYHTSRHSSHSPSPHLRQSNNREVNNTNSVGHHTSYHPSQSSSSHSRQSDSRETRITSNAGYLIPKHSNSPLSHSRQSNNSEFGTTSEANLNFVCELESGIGHTAIRNMDIFDKITGYAAPEDLQLCSLQGLINYADFFVDEENQERVAKSFFEKGKVFDRKWNIFYLHLGRGYFPSIILFVLTSQFEKFLSEINEKLGTTLATPSGEIGMAFKMKFPNDGTKSPRYLGEINDKAMADQLKTAIPPQTYKPDRAQRPVIIPDDRSIEAFRGKIQILLTLEKKKKENVKAKKQKDKAEKQKSWGERVKRVQRYLGLREIRSGHHQAMRQLNGNTSDWGRYDDAIAEALANPDHSQVLDVNIPSRFPMESDLVFISVDVEAYEKDHTKITEIGVATLDTRDIIGHAPGDGGKHWYTKIRSRHFRIREHINLRNGDYVHGCPDSFDFGQSEWISLKNAPQIIASCFKAPFSGPVESIQPIEDGEEVEEITPKRKVVFVGHDTLTDVRYLRDLGYNVLNIPPHELIDTAEMYRWLRRETSNRNLGSVLADLGIAGWNLHNAGNDATYTLQSMVAIAIQEIKQKESSERDQIDENRIAEAMEKARLDAIEEQKGWDDDGGDGGAPVRPPSSLSGGYTTPPKEGADTKRKAANATAMASSSSQSRPDISSLKKQASIALKSKDDVLINVVAQEAIKDQGLALLMQFVAEDTSTSDQMAEFLHKIDRIKNFMKAKAAKDREDAQRW